MEYRARLYTTLFVVVLLALVAIVIMDVGYYLYEDGSFILHGCLPWHLCAK